MVQRRAWQSLPKADMPTHGPLTGATVLQVTARARTTVAKLTAVSRMLGIFAIAAHLTGAQ